MQIFRCPTCGARLYFGNLQCRCGQAVAFDPDRQMVEVAGSTCANRTRIACDWRDDRRGLCRSCAMTRTVPDLTAGDNLRLWSATEQAKRWMLAGLARWGWCTDADAGPRPVFHLLSEETRSGPANVVMGHASGVITINVTEASEPVLVQRRAEFGELYRTMLGHMRHEMAHYLFDRLAAERDGFPEAFRAIFGDERADYGAALSAHYASPRDPGGTHISAYATAHPHEDWAETIAHLLHLVDLLDSALAAGMRVPGLPEGVYDAYADLNAGAMLAHAVEVSIAGNHLNRAMDLPDLYPFVLTPQVRAKLAFAHGALRQGPESSNKTS
ncbi:zinc-binding metallopeptidase family protein [Palleronia caenipelagi]|uniref:Zinc-ribbon domain-containing protein n=1 Tax=Palleronia caenipelagi TaxID=2489174 RepID=A0A547PRJ7_9RHOB|nr:putative zinc-binding metallopeptidase [Palleronia caenipelagi]TRD16684.1 hypothetical protein FEV53_13860 [Palleronia caenipelagi]